MTTGQPDNFVAGSDALRIGLLTDAHYADKSPAIGRVYRDSIDKLRTAVDGMSGLDLDLAVELGDFIDSTGIEDADRLMEINSVFKRLAVPRYYVLGNHCLERLSKPQYLEIVGQDRSFFSFDMKGVHLIVLDACFTRDGMAYGEGAYDWYDSDIPAAEREWLAADLQATTLPTILFVHQRLDSPADTRYGIFSSPAVREILEASGQVKLVAQGHHHPGGFSLINGIAYLTLPSLVTGNDRDGGGYSVLQVRPDGGFVVHGFGEHESFDSSTLESVQVSSR